MVECLEKHPLVTVIERGPCMKMPDGEQSLAVEIAIDVKIVDTPFSEIKTVPKYLSQLLLEVLRLLPTKKAFIFQTTPSFFRPAFLITSILWKCPGI